uniref:Uncharacterized protein n=1 Tax=Romanomermis culicivorax TaxID=13658 RepID=A0A915HVZ4_ROMCU
MMNVGNSRLMIGIYPRKGPVHHLNQS